MLKWFSNWNKANPKDIYGPGIVIGVVGGAVFVAAMLVAFGQPYATASVQTGPRGTGMDIVKRAADREVPDPTLAAYAATTSAPVKPLPGAALARTGSPTAEPLLGDLTVENYDRLVAAMRLWTGIPTLFDGPETYQTVVARRMIEMTRNINENYDGHVNLSGEGGVNCYTCHRGQPVPSQIWFKDTPHDPGNKSVAGWAAVQNRAVLQTSYTSLPADALESYLVNGESIKVHDLESRVARDPSLPTIQNAERTYSLMNYFANSLNVNCTFCHNTRAFYDPGQVTPQWAGALLGIQMVNELNNDYLLPLAAVLPPERLGPAFADGPKAACATCHKGYQKPLGGANMTADWPELAASGAPAYE